MDVERFDRLTRAFSRLLTRRTLAGALGLGVMAAPELAEARKKRKKRRKKKKVKKNGFGCVDAGKFCKNGGQCCSGACQGKKDKKKCQARGESTCLSGQDVCISIVAECTTDGGAVGACGTTTGKSSFCFATGGCFACNKDADCEAVCGEGAACVVCGECFAEGGTGCVSLTAGGCLI